MSAQIVFDNIDLRNIILGYLYSLDKIIELDMVYVFEYHKNNKQFTKLISELTMDLAAEYESINIVKWLHYNRVDGCTEFALDIAANNGDIELLEFLHENRNEGCTMDALIYGADNNHLNIVKWLHKYRINDIPEYAYSFAIDNSVRNSNLEMTQYLYEKYKERFNNNRCFCDRIINIAAGEDNVEVLKWLHEITNKYSYKEMNIAARYGHIENIKWLHNNRNINIINERTDIILLEQNHDEKSRAIVYAAEAGYIDIVKFLYEIERNITIGIIQEAVNAAAKNGHIDIIKYLYYLDPKRKIYNKYAINYAARGGLLDIIIFIHTTNNENIANCNYGRVCSKNAMDNAALIGNLNIIKWLHKNRTEGCSKNAFYNACKNGHYDVAEWLIINKREYCAYTSRNIDNAAANGNLKIIELLDHYKISLPSKRAMNLAAEKGYLLVVQYLHKNHNDVGCDTYAMDNAAKNGYLYMVLWLHENRNEGCSKKAMDMAAKNGCLHIIKWLHKNRTEGCSENAMNMAAKNGNFNVVKFLHENRNEGCTTNAIDDAATAGHIRIVKYLINNRQEGFTQAALIGSKTHKYYTIHKYLCENISRIAQTVS